MFFYRGDFTLVYAMIVVTLLCASYFLEFVMAVIWDWYINGSFIKMCNIWVFHTKSISVVLKEDGLFILSFVNFSSLTILIEWIL